MATDHAERLDGERADAETAAYVSPVADFLALLALTSAFLLSIAVVIVP